MTEPVTVLGAAAAERLADGALGLTGRAGAADIEVVVQGDRGGLTRFANSQVHQNVWTEDVSVSVRVVTDDGRVGVVTAHTDDPAAVEQAGRDALALAKVAPADPEFPGLAPAASIREVPFDQATADASPGERAAAVRAVLAEVDDGLDAAGAYRTGVAELGVYTTAGQCAHTAITSADLTVVVTGPRSSGYAEAGGRSAAEIDPTDAGRRAVGKACAGVDATDVEPGTWRVVLEPPAVAALVQFLAYLGFGGRDYLENRSFVAGRLGERLFDEGITLVDDALSPSTIGFPVDFEGTPKAPVDLIRDGVVAGVVHDRWTARKLEVSSTGHGLPAPNPWGPIAVNPILLPGRDGSVDDLVAGCERGLLVTRFHYTNVVHPLEAILTGMTRDGTFLIEDGQVTSAVRNLRFTQSLLEALARVEAISTETGWGSELFFGGARTPALRLPAFTFTSTTTFG